MVDIQYRTFQALRPHFNALARVGYYKIVLKPLSTSKHLLHSFYRVIICILVLGYNLQHIIRVVQVRHSTEKMVNTFFILLTILNTLGKQAAFNLKSRRLDQIIAVINGPFFAPTNMYHVKVLKENALEMSRLLTLYQMAVLTCGVLWTVFPIVNKVLGEEVEFTGYYPFDTIETLAFTLALAYTSILITVQGYAHVTLDCTIVAFIALARTQIKILRYNLEHLLDDDDDKWNWNVEQRINEQVTFKGHGKDGYKIQQRLIKCVDHYDQIVRFTKEIESIFGEAMLNQFFVMAWVICMTVYKIVGLNILSTEFVSMAVYLCCMLAQLFLYCYYGTELTVEVGILYQVEDEVWQKRQCPKREDLIKRVLCLAGPAAAPMVDSESIVQSVYCSRWLALSPRFRHQLFVMMQCYSRPLALRVAYVISMSLETYISVLKTSYTLFTFLNRK